MQVVKILSYNESFESIDVRELKEGDLFAFEKDFRFCWDGGELYLDYQIRQWKEYIFDGVITDAGGLLLCSCDLLDYAEDFDGLTDEEILTDEVFRSLESAGLLYAFHDRRKCWGKFYEIAAALVKKYLEWEPCEK